MPILNQNAISNCKQAESSSGRVRLPFWKHTISTYTKLILFRLFAFIGTWNTTITLCLKVPPATLTVWNVPLLITVSDLRPCCADNHFHPLHILTCQTELAKFTLELQAGVYSGWCSKLKVPELPSLLVVIYSMYPLLLQPTHQVYQPD